MPLCLACKPKWFVVDHDLAYERDSYEDLKMEPWIICKAQNLWRICEYNRKEVSISMEKNIVLIKGDGIGPEIVDEALKVLDRVCGKYGHTFHYTRILMGGESIDEYGVPLTDEALETAQKQRTPSCSAALAAQNGTISPVICARKKGFWRSGKAWDLFANVRPAYLYPELKAACPLRDEIIGDGFDMVVMRELTGGLYFGARETVEQDGQMVAKDTLTYSEAEIRRIAVKGL